MSKFNLTENGKRLVTSVSYFLVSILIALLNRLTPDQSLLSIILALCSLVAILTGTLLLWILLFVEL